MVTSDGKSFILYVALVFVLLSVTVCCDTAQAKTGWLWNCECVFQVVLDCVLKKDIQYTKANPKFHHWNTDEKRFGLTFERCDDAKAFDHGVRHAVAELSEGKKERDKNKYTCLL